MTNYRQIAQQQHNKKEFEIKIFITRTKFFVINNSYTYFYVIQIVAKYKYEDILQKCAVM